MTNTELGDFAKMVAAWRARRGWQHLFALLLGAVTGYVGAADLAVRFGTHKTPAFGVHVEVACYVLGWLVFAWGGARGTARRLPLWIVGSLLFGVVIALVVVVTVALGPHSGVSDSGDGTSEPRPPRPAPDPRDPKTLWRGGTPLLSTAVLDPGIAEALLGGRGAGPQPVNPRGNRNRSVVIWRGPGNQAPTLSVTVRSGVTGGATTRSARARDAAVPLAGVGDSAFLLRHTTSIGELVAVRASVRDWLVTVAVRARNPQRDNAPLVIEQVRRALSLLDAADRANTAR